MTNDNQIHFSIVDVDLPGVDASCGVPVARLWLAGFSFLSKVRERSHVMHGIVDNRETKI
jgi:hypothetical protein